MTEMRISRLSIYLQLTAQKETSMNRYGLLARQHWQSAAPQRYAALEDPTRYFEALGETIAAQVTTMSDHLEQKLPSELAYLDRVAQLRTIQKQAEELVLSELVYSVEPETSSLTGELEQLLAELPSPAMIEDSLQRLELEAQEEAEREGWSTALLSEEDQARKDQLTALLPLVRMEREPEAMSEAELSDRILALRPFWNQETRSLVRPQ